MRGLEKIEVVAAVIVKNGNILATQRGYGEFKGKYLDLTKRGYYVSTQKRPDAPYIYIICMGEKNTGGYSLKVKEVNKVDDKTEIIVEEIEPKKNETTTMAFTYPTIVVEFPQEQENIIIKNTEGKEFTKLEG